MTITHLTQDAHDEEFGRLFARFAGQLQRSAEATEQRDSEALDAVSAEIRADLEAGIDRHELERGAAYEARTWAWPAFVLLNAPMGGEIAYWTGYRFHADHVRAKRFLLESEARRERHARRAARYTSAVRIDRIEEWRAGL